MTSEACGRLDAALKDGIVDPAKSSAYGYCDVDSGAMLSHSYETCLECVQATNGFNYLANCKLLALQTATTYESKADSREQSLSPLKQAASSSPPSE